MAQHSIVKLAQQGNPRAIAYLITQTLQKYGITARANRKDSCLRLLLEAEQVPDQSIMSMVIRRGMEKLHPASLKTIKLYGRQKGQKDPAWRQVIQLVGLAQSNNQPVIYADDHSEAPIFRLDDLAPDAMILLPVEPQVQLNDINPDAVILLPVEPQLPLPEQSTESSSDLSSDFSSDFPGDSLPDPTVDSVDADEMNADQAAEVARSEHKSEPLPLELLHSIKLPKRLSRILLGLLWLRLGADTLTLVYSLLSAGSFSLYTGLDLANTNQPFASLLSAVIGIADFLFTPLERLHPWLSGVTFFLFLLWLHRLHLSLPQLLGAYPISPLGAVMRFVLPLYHVWGIGNVCLTLAKRLSTPANQVRCYRLRRLTGWLYLLLFIAAGLFGFSVWLLNLPVNIVTNAAHSLWLYVARDGVAWLLSLVWLRLVRTIWRAVRQVYQERVLAFLPTPMPQMHLRSRPVNIRAILLGGGAALLSLIGFNCLLWLIASSVFLSNGLRPESVLPTFFASNSLLILVLLGSSLCIGLGGFLTASLARASSLLHVLGLGILLTLIGLALQRLPNLTELPFWFQTASAASIIPAALIGGGVRQWLKTL